MRERERLGVNVSVSGAGYVLILIFKMPMPVDSVDSINNLSERERPKMPCPASYILDFSHIMSPVSLHLNYPSRIYIYTVNTL